MLCTLLSPTRGRARVAGFDVATEPDAVRLSIGVALQDAALNDRIGIYSGGMKRRLDLAAALVNNPEVLGLVFTGFAYAIALKTGNPAAVNSSFILFFPFAFLTTSFLSYNPVTYLLEALRSLITTGWDGTALAKGAAAVAAVGVVSMTLAFLALRGRIRRG